MLLTPPQFQAAAKWRDTDEPSMCVCELVCDRVREDVCCADAAAPPPHLKKNLASIIRRWGFLQWINKPIKRLVQPSKRKKCFYQHQPPAPPHIYLLPILPPPPPPHPPIVDHKTLKLLLRRPKWEIWTDFMIFGQFCYKTNTAAAAASMGLRK